MSSYLSSNAKPDYPQGVRRCADAKLFSGGSRYGVVRDAHELQKDSTPANLSARRHETSRQLIEQLARPYSFSPLIFRWHQSLFRFTMARFNRVMRLGWPSRPVPGPSEPA